MSIRRLVELLKSYVGLWGTPVVFHHMGKTYHIALTELRDDKLHIVMEED